MKDRYCSYYTEEHLITSYMTKMIDIRDGDNILEPSAGEGVFVDEILSSKKDVAIKAIDINEKAIEILKKKFENKSNIEIKKMDTLLDTSLDECEKFDKIIGNPPYGAWQDIERRNILKKKYDGYYVKETYSLFLLRCIDLLKDKGILSFIIPDTFLFLNMHQRLRIKILKETKIKEILIFPSKFFPGVSFGYSNLSIITLEKSNEEDALNNTIRVIKGFKKVEEFEKINKLDTLKHIQIYDLKQLDVLQTEDHRFILASKEILNIIQKSNKNIGDIAEVVTGFYCGNNKKFIKTDDENFKGAKGYNLVKTEKIYDNKSQNGIDGVEEGYIPYIKGSSSTSYYRKNNPWYIRWDKKTIEFYINDKKARFQNSSYYFKCGVGIPMVKSRKINATIMREMLFDQSIVGIFPKKDISVLYLLALFNSDIINRLIHTINPTANNSANYVKRVPYIEPKKKEDLEEIEGLVKEIINDMKEGKDELAEQKKNKINCIINEIYL